MRILVACEESQAVCLAFRAKGHEAYSCDIQECSGGHPQWHIQGDAIAALAGGWIVTQSGRIIYIERWDLVIAHPSCTYIANSGVRWLVNKEGHFVTQREKSLIKAIAFFNAFVEFHSQTGVPLCIENPIPHKYAVRGIGNRPGIGSYSQIVQPWQFGHLEQKATCLWLYSLPELHPTNSVKHLMMSLPYKDRAKVHCAKVHCAAPGRDRAKIRSKTFPGIARAMADQWG